MSDDDLKEFEIADQVAAEATSHIEIPEKFQNKSPEDIVKSYVELEKLHGRQSREMGELRKLADDLVQRSLNQPTTPAKVEEEVDFYSDPAKYINNAIQSNPRLAEIEQATQAARRATVMNELTAKYGDVKEIVSDPAFQEWVGASKVRSELFVRADRGLDMDAATELISNWTERKMINSTQKAKEVQEEDLSRKLGDAGSTKGSSGAGDSGGKIYRRADIIRLQITDPRRYEQLIPEIRKAYADGRVK
jgi:hypothetical protein